MILQTSFDALVSPDNLTQELSILFAVLIIAMLYASLRLRSLFATFGWMLMIVTLMVTMFTDLQLLWFWLAVITEGFFVVLASIQYTRMAARD